MNANPLLARGRRLLMALCCAASPIACSTSVPNRNPTGEVFPSIVGLVPGGGSVEIPAEYSGTPVVLLVGLSEDCQFDLDRWVVGLGQLGLDAPILELPLDSDLVPSRDSRWIQGSPSIQTLEGVVASRITLSRADQSAVFQLTGNQEDQLLRVVVLDGQGRIAWFGDRGFSPSNAMAVQAAIVQSDPTFAAGVSKSSSDSSSESPVEHEPHGELVGKPFPLVTGTSLADETIEIPTAFAGEPVILLIGYDQEAQFDIDRWVLGLVTEGVDVRLVELPTIPGMFAKLASGWIDSGMRSGIPREDWASVVTLYGGAADPVVELTGRERGERSRVLLLDGDGQIAWFDDEGFEDGKPAALTRAVDHLSAR